MLEEKRCSLPGRTMVALTVFAVLLSGCQPMATLTATPLLPDVALVINPDITDVLAGDIVALTAETSGRDLRFKWSASRGKLSAFDAPAVLYTAPDTEGVDTVTVEVSSANGTTVKHVSFNIISPPTRTPVPTEIPATTSSFALPVLELFPQASSGKDFYWANPSGNEVTYQYEESEECRHSGMYGLRLTYTMSDDTMGDDRDGGWGVHWANAPSRSFDASEFSTFTFWVKGMASGETFQIGFKDTNLKEIKVDSTRFAVVTTTGWSVVNVPLSEFRDKGVDIASLENVSIGFNSAHGSGQICIDDIAFQ
jgi:hypothetical protein